MKSSQPGDFDILGKRGQQMQRPLGVAWTQYIQTIKEGECDSTSHGV